MAEDALVDRTSKKVRIRAHVNNDIVQRVVVKENGVNMPWAGVTAETTLKDVSSSDAAANFSWSTGVAGEATLSLTRAQTILLGEGEFYGSLTLIKDGQALTRMSIVLELISQEDEDG